MDNTVNTKKTKTAGSNDKMTWKRASEIMHSLTGLEDIVEWIVCPGTFYIDANGYPVARIIPYFQSRTAMNMLDTIFGRENWFTTRRIDKISDSLAYIDLTLVVTLEGKTVEAHGESETFSTSAVDVNLIKNQVTEAFKRACVELGMFRQLYFAGPFYAIFHPNGEYEYKPRGSSTPFRWSPPPPEVVAEIVYGTAKQKMQAGIRAMESAPADFDAATEFQKTAQNLIDKGAVSEQVLKFV